MWCWSPGWYPQARVYEYITSVLDLPRAAGYSAYPDDSSNVARLSRWNDSVSNWIGTWVGLNRFRCPQCPLSYYLHSVVFCFYDVLCCAVLPYFIFRLYRFHVSYSNPICHVLSHFSLLCFFYRTESYRRIRTTTE